MIKKNYYKLSSDEFKSYLYDLKNNQSTLHFFNNADTPYFLLVNNDVNQLVLQLHKKQLELDSLYQSLSSFQKELIIQSYKIDEIQSTNNIENIKASKSDIFGIVNDVKSIHNKKIISIIHSYNMLEQLSKSPINHLSQIKELYELLMEYAYDSSNDHIDGTYFRKNPVYITNGIKVVHTGFNPEEKIIEGMQEYLQVSNNKELDIYLRLLITHFMFETIHPYYDGNGRCGRFLMSLQLYHEESTLFAYCLATSINNEKEKYYKALEVARDKHEYGCMNDYIDMLGHILLNGIDSTIDDMQKKIQEYNNLLPVIDDMDLTKSEKKIYECLLQASLFSYFGVSNEKIIEEAKVSKRTLITTINKFREMNLIDDYKLGKITYHKLKKWN